MLILSRNKDQSIIIGDDIEIRVVKVDGDSVKLAINAPKSISILRKELYDSIKHENTQASKNTNIPWTPKPN